MSFLFRFRIQYERIDSSLNLFAINLRKQARVHRQECFHECSQILRIESQWHPIQCAKSIQFANKVIRLLFDQKLQLIDLTHHSKTGQLGGKNSLLI